MMSIFVYFFCVIFIRRVICLCSMFVLPYPCAAFFDSINWKYAISAVKSLLPRMDFICEWARERERGRESSEGDIGIFVIFGDKPMTAGEREEDESDVCVLTCGIHTVDAIAYFHAIYLAIKFESKSQWNYPIESIRRIIASSFLNEQHMHLPCTGAGLRVCVW